MTVPFISVKQLDHAIDLPLPTRQTPGSSGCDVCAAISSDIILHPNERSLVPTGLVLDIPIGFEVQVRPRSGLAYKHGVTVLNSPGTIDSDYRGEVKILLINHGVQSFTIKRGERIAQLVPSRVCHDVSFIQVSHVTDSIRGPGGFGSTGV
ncbi:hypothetical protein P9112_003116 [Eukaryota sp. TZLM1-RC]